MPLLKRNYLKNPRKCRKAEKISYSSWRFPSSARVTLLRPRSCHLIKGSWPPWGMAGSERYIVVSLLPCISTWCLGVFCSVDYFGCLTGNTVFVRCMVSKSSRIFSFDEKVQRNWCVSGLSRTPSPFSRTRYFGVVLGYVILSQLASVWERRR